jgi:hypothetical protein
MRKLPWGSILAGVLAAFFLFGSLGNMVAPASILEEYKRWGYPPWFHFVTGAMEFAVAALLVSRSTRFAGTVLATILMCAAAATVVLHGEYAHAIAPLIVMVFSVLVGATTMRSRLPAS